jgi:coronin-1B/1C/6
LDFYFGRNEEFIQTEHFYTGICVELPLVTYGRVADKSSISFFEHLHILGGAIDADYRGPIMDLVHNLKDISHTISKGDKVTNNRTEHGGGGFGSTG